MTPTPYPHQLEAARFLAARRRAGLFDKRGLGKTISALVAAKAVGAQSILVVAPPQAVYNWRREFATWLKRTPYVIDARKRASVLDGLQSFREVCAVVSDGLLLCDDVHSRLTEREWDVVIVDEWHRYKNPDAKRTARMTGLGKENVEGFRPILRGDGYWWALTGTPMPNHAGELWTFLATFAPERIAKRRRVRGVFDKPKRPMDAPYVSYPSFEARFCKLRRTDYGMKPVGNKNVGELKKRAEGTWLRRTEGIELPPVRYEYLSVGTPGLLPHVQRPDGYELHRAIGDGDVSHLQHDRSIAEWRRLCGAVKAHECAKIIIDEFKQGLDKLVVFAHHISAIDIMREALENEGIKVRIITGAVSARRRAEIVEEFQEGDLQVVIANIIAGGSAITLTAASELLFVEMSYVPGDNEQAAGRIDRMSQTRPTRVRCAMLDGSIDEDIVRVLQRKLRAIREVLED